MSVYSNNERFVVGVGLEIIKNNWRSVLLTIRREKIKLKSNSIHTSTNFFNDCVLVAASEFSDIQVVRSDGVGEHFRWHPLENRVMTRH